MKIKAKIFWAYTSEILLSSAITALTCLLYGTPKVTEFIISIAGDSAAYVFSILLAAALALIWTIFSKIDSSFYNWLNSKGALEIYLKAMRYVVIIELLAVTSSILTRFIQKEEYLVLVVFLMIMGLINGLTMISNIFDLIKLNILFERKKNKTE